MRDLLDLVVGSLDEPGADGRTLAARAHFSRDHLDRLLAAATGETPVQLRRRLLLERAAWHLRTGAATPSDAARAADYGSLAAFSRAYAKAFGAPPSAYTGDFRLDAPNGVHFHPPAGLLVPGEQRPAGPWDLLDRLVGHHAARVAELLHVAGTLSDAQLDDPRRPGHVVLAFEGEEPTARVMAERLVFALEVWVAAMAGRTAPVPQDGRDLERRHARASAELARIARTVRDRGAYDDSFVDALCEPPQSFPYGAVLAHVLTFGAIRREALAGLLAELGADVPSHITDPILWEHEQRSTA